MVAWADNKVVGVRWGRFLDGWAMDGRWLGRTLHGGMGGGIGGGRVEGGVWRWMRAQVGVGWVLDGVHWETIPVPLSSVHRSLNSLSLLFFSRHFVTVSPFRPTPTPGPFLIGRFSSSLGPLLAPC